MSPLAGVVIGKDMIAMTRDGMVIRFVRMLLRINKHFVLVLVMSPLSM